MGISYRFRDREISFENRKIFPPLAFCGPAKGVPLEWVTGAGGQKNRIYTGLRNKFDDIFNRLDTMFQRDGHTYRHRATAKTALTNSVALYKRYSTVISIQQLIFQTLPK